MYRSDLCVCIANMLDYQSSVTQFISRPQCILRPTSYDHTRIEALSIFDTTSQNAKHREKPYLALLSAADLACDLRKFTHRCSCLASIFLLPSPTCDVLTFEVQGRARRLRTRNRCERVSVEFCFSDAGSRFHLRQGQGCPRNHCLQICTHNAPQTFGFN